MGASLHGQFTQLNSQLSIVHMYTDLGEGAGLSLVDVNGDGRDDITFATGIGQPIGIYLAAGQGFDITFPEGLGILVEEASRSINWVDYDNDGDKDLFVTNLNQIPNFQYQGNLRLFRQNGDFTFTDVTIESGIIAENPISYGSAWADYDNDGHLDLYIGGYGQEFGGANYLFHNLGDGTFEDVTSVYGMRDLQGRSFTSVFFDADMDGHVDLFTANDRTGSYNKFYRGLEDGTYEDQSVASGLYTEFDAMGVDVGDYDNDGDLDVYVTNTASPIYDPYIGGVLFQNSGDATFTGYGNFPLGTDYSTFWGCSFVDFDYDRDLDLFAVNQGANGDQDSRRLFVNEGSGSYTDYTGDELDGTGSFFSGLAQGDINGDGVTDLVVMGILLGNSEIWAGPPTENGHVAVRLEGTVSNRDGVGSIIEVWVDGEKRIDQTSIGNSFASQDSDNYRFGLGLADFADSVIVRWPSGLVNIVKDVPAGAQLDLLESESSSEGCVPTADLQYEIGSGLERSLSLTDMVNVDTMAVNWTIDGIPVGTGASIDYLFDDFGSYLLCAELTSSCATYELCELIDITCPEPIASYSVVIEELQIVASDSSDYSDEVEWYLDGTLVGTGGQLELALTEPGEYTFCQVVQSVCGIDSLCEDLSINCTTPTPEIIWDSPSDLILNAYLAQAYDSVLWVVEGSMIEDVVLDTAFTEAGFYSVCVYVWDQCGTDSSCVVVDIECESPVSEFSWTIDSLEVQVTDLSIGDTVNWTLNGEALQLTDELSFLLPSAGEYELCAQVVDTCGIVQSCDSILVDFPTGLDDYRSIAEQIDFWPNPARTHLFIRFPEVMEGYSLMDLSGRSIGISPPVIKDSVMQFSVSQLENGVYCLILESHQGVRHPIFFIKD